MRSGRIAVLGLAMGILAVIAGCGDKGGNGDSDETAPVVVLSFPDSDTTLGGIVQLFAEATDNIAVSHVEFFIDGGFRDDDSTMPYTCEWNCMSLANGSQHEIYAKGLDASGNAGYSDTVTVTISHDAVAPAAVADLTITDTTGNSVTLRWTAPGGDGLEGRAKIYDVRYWRTDIDTAMWDVLTPAVDEPTPSASGTEETFTVGGLLWGAHYTFVMKTADSVGNWSEISNLVSATAYAPIATEQVVDCEPSPGGDANYRGFYLRDVPRGRLADVVLYLSANDAGTYTMRLTIRADTYDGALIGVSRCLVELESDSELSRESHFLFGLPEIAADSLLTFSLEFVSGPPGTWRAYHAGTPCGSTCPAPCAVVETEGVVPPLDTPRSNGVAMELFVEGVPHQY